MRLFKRVLGWVGAKAPTTTPTEPSVGEENLAASPHRGEGKDRPLMLSELEEKHIWQLFGRAALIEICKKPESFGFDAELDGIFDFYNKARQLQGQFWDALKLTEGNLEAATDPTLPVWRTAAKLTELDWTSRKRRENV